MGTRFSARPDRSCGPPSLLYNGYRVFPGGKERPGRAADHSPPSSSRGHGRVELYLYPSSGPHRACNGITLPLLHTHKVCSCVIYASKNKQQRLPYSALSDRFLKERWRMFTARYNLGLQKNISLFFLELLKYSHTSMVLIKTPYLHP